MYLENIPIKNLSAISPFQFFDAGISRAKQDQPREHEERYFADGSRCTRKEEGHIPMMAFLSVRFWVMDNSKKHVHR